MEATPLPTTAASSVHPVSAASNCPATSVSHDVRFSLPSRCSATTRILSDIFVPRNQSVGQASPFAVPNTQQRAANRALHQKPRRIDHRPNLDAAINEGQKNQVCPQQQLAHRHQHGALLFIS